MYAGLQIVNSKMDKGLERFYTALDKLKVDFNLFKHALVFYFYSIEFSGDWYVDELFGTDLLRFGTRAHLGHGKSVTLWEITSGACRNNKDTL